MKRCVGSDTGLEANDMSSRIFKNIVLTAFFSVLLTAVLVVVSMYSVYEDGMTSDLKMEAGYIE